MIAEKILESKKAKIAAYPTYVNRASELGHECTRYLTYLRTNWRDKALPSPQLMSIFELGNLFETKVLNDLAEAGFVVTEQQRAFTWDKYQISGHCDGKILMDGEMVPLEIKSMSPFVFDKINTIDDLTHGKYPYLRKYPGQLCIYCLLSNIDRGVFLFVSKVTGAIKELEMKLDYDLGEKLLQKAEAVNAHIAAGTLPDRIPYTENTCDSCPFVHICLPERIGKEVEVVDNAELLEALERWHELKGTVKEYDELDTMIKKQLEGRDKLLIGNFYVTGAYRDKTSYAVPDEIKKQYAEKSRYWVRKVSRV